MKKSVLLGGVIAFALIAAALVGVLIQPVVVEGATVTRGDLERTESLLGEYVPKVRQNVVCTKGGKVGSVAIAVGDTLTAGDTVITLSADELTAELQSVETALRNLDNEAQAAVSVNADSEDDEESRQALALAMEGAESAKALAQSIGIGYAELNEALEHYISISANAVFSADEPAEETAAAPADNLAEEEKLLGWRDELNAQMADLNVFSTVSGNVISVSVTEGTEVQEGDVLAVTGNERGGLITAVDTTGEVEMDDEVKLVCDGLSWSGWVVEKDGNTIYIKPETGFSAEGEITVVPTIDAATDVCLVPTECLGEDESGEYVLILNDGLLERRAITTSLEQNGMVAVTSGIGVGETAVCYPDRYVEGTRAELND